MSEPLLDLFESWCITLRAENKSPNSIAAYRSGIRLYVDWCQQNDHPVEITRELVLKFTADLITAGKESATVRLRQAALRQFAEWLVEEGELSENPVVGMKPPKLPTKVIDALTDDQLRDLVKACKGPEFQDKRDEAIVRLMAETGLRAGELVALEVNDVDVKEGLATVRRGKGDKGRVVPFGAQTAVAVDRYIRLRKMHRLAATPTLWLGASGRGFAYYGLNDALRTRAQTAGIDGFHLHLLRHTAATRWLRARGSEQGLMAIAGWSSRSMLNRYTSSSASERAASEARTLNLGDL